MDSSASTSGARDPAQARSAVVAGGTGLVGGVLLQLLARDARYRSVTSLVRRETSAPPGVSVRRADFARLDELDLPDVDEAFCCLGTTRREAGSAAAFRRVDLDYVVAFARRAQRAGALRFMLVSSLGASSGSPFLYPARKVSAKRQSLALDSRPWSSCGRPSCSARAHSIGQAKRWRCVPVN